MSRRKIIIKRKILSDFRFDSNLLAKFINILMISGKKFVSEKIVYSSLDNLVKIINKPHLDIFEIILNNVRPSVEVRSRRVGGSTYQVPIEINLYRSNTLAMRWIIHSARKRNNKSMILRLTNEFLDAFENKGNAVKKKDEVHRMAEANKAFAHYRW